ncbi:MAG: ferritin-like domain-containing protein [Mycobacteriales bacterium]
MAGDRDGHGRPRHRPGELVVADREELLFLLGEAAEVEHAVCCSYLYAAFTLRTGPADGLAGEQQAAVTRWRRTLARIALQEMVHLAMANNLLAAVGGAPHLGRAPFPRRIPYAPEITLALTAFDEATLQRFLYIERPEDLDIADVAGAVRRARSVPVPPEPPVVPEPQGFASLGELYRGLERGLCRLVDRYGEAAVFVGTRRTQSAATLFAFPAELPELLPVTGLASARQAIEVIVAEGEGTRGDWSTAHFGQFLTMLTELRDRRERDPSFVPARPAAANPHVRDSRDLLRTPGWRREIGRLGLPVSTVDDPAAVAVSGLFDACYGLLLRLLERLFQHGGETTAELRLLADAAVEVMWSVIRPLGELLTRLPAGPSSPGRTAGPAFRLDGWTPLTAHRRAAWIVLRERLAELAEVAGQLGAVSPVLPEVARSLGQLAGRLGADPVRPV